MADCILPERAVRRYVMSNGAPGVELHYQVERGRRLVVYDLLRGGKNRGEFESRNGSARSNDTQEWRLLPSAPLMVDSLRKQMRDLMANHDWHPIYQLIGLIAKQINHNDYTKHLEVVFGSSWPHVPEEIRRWEAAHYVTLNVLYDIGATYRGKRAGFDREFRLPPDAESRDKRRKVPE